MNESGGSKGSANEIKIFKRCEAKAEQAMTSERQNIMWRSHLSWIMSPRLNDFIYLQKIRMNYPSLEIWALILMTTLRYAEPILRNKQATSVPSLLVLSVTYYSFIFNICNKNISF